MNFGKITNLRKSYRKYEEQCKVLITVALEHGQNLEINCQFRVLFAVNPIASFIPRQCAALN